MRWGRGVGRAPGRVAAARARRLGARANSSAVSSTTPGCSSPRDAPPNSLPENEHRDLDSVPHDVFRVAGGDGDGRRPRVPPALDSSRDAGASGGRRPDETAAVPRFVFPRCGLRVPEPGPSRTPRSSTDARFETRDGCRLRRSMTYAARRTATSALTATTNATRRNGAEEDSPDPPGANAATGEASSDASTFAGALVEGEVEDAEADGSPGGSPGGPDGASGAGGAGARSDGENARRLRRRRRRLGIRTRPRGARARRRRRRRRATRFGSTGATRSVPRTRRSWALTRRGRG